MHSTSLISALALVASIPFSLAKNIDVTVGANAELKFNPESVTAAVGDTVSFSFFPRNHTVVQSSFAEPCQPLQGGFFAGFQPLAAGPGPVKFVVTVNDTKPIWAYCAQNTGTHCQRGMAIVINEAPPPTENTLEAYKALAAATNSSSVPPNVGGGVFVPFNASGGGAASGTAGVTGTASGTAGYPGPTGANPPYEGAATKVNGFSGAALALAAAVVGAGFIQ